MSSWKLQPCKCSVEARIHSFHVLRLKDTSAWTESEENNRSNCIVGWGMEVVRRCEYCEFNDGCGVGLILLSLSDCRTAFAYRALSSSSQVPGTHVSFVGERAPDTCPAGLFALPILALRFPDSQTVPIDESKYCGSSFSGIGLRRCWDVSAGLTGRSCCPRISDLLPQDKASILRNSLRCVQCACAWYWKFHRLRLSGLTLMSALYCQVLRFLQESKGHLLIRGCSLYPRWF